MGSRAGFDFDSGLLDDGYGILDRFLAGQLQFLPMPRKENGTARSFFVGLSSREAWVIGGHGIFGKLFVVWGGR